ncbi:hypothetical protein AB8Q92_22350, partial [Klebsiella quasipneumoniae subsp. similipneumoniae]
NSLSAKVSCWLIRLLILGSGYNTMISHLGLIRTFLSGSLQVGIGRYKKMSLNNEPVYSVLTVGDQLLWGAAEPLRRMLNILLGKI